MEDSGGGIELLQIPVGNLEPHLLLLSLSISIRIFNQEIDVKYSKAHHTYKYYRNNKTLKGFHQFNYTFSFLNHRINILLNI